MSEEAKKTSWFKGVKAEFKKISWPTKDTLTKETIAVLFISVLLGVIITVIDLIIRTGIEFIVR
ncbi:MAG: preprotein translocase subunit SecE [Thermoflexaceae bacterium]|nr:preprotein translocase subunit SecE [Thermoflexaceae bacterium]